ncbi:MAG: hypothetical protein WDN06_11765 [Asticcacaulis sp.]
MPSFSQQFSKARQGRGRAIAKPAVPEVQQTLYDSVANTHAVARRPYGPAVFPLHLAHQQTPDYIGANDRRLTKPCLLGPDDPVYKPDFFRRQMICFHISTCFFRTLTMKVGENHP